MTPDRSLLLIAARAGAVGFVGAAALLLAIGQTEAQGIAGHDSNAPVNFSADRIELLDRQNRVVLAGNVDILQGDMQLRAARTSLAYNRGGGANSGLKIQRIDATGGVSVARGGERASGDVGIYDFNRRIITLVGNVALRRGADTLNGGRLVMDLASGVTSVDGRGGRSSVAPSSSQGAPVRSSGGRVSGTFSVPHNGN